MKTVSRSLQKTFGPKEHDVHCAIRKFPELLEEIIRLTGFRGPFRSEDVRLEFGGQPDMLCLTEGDQRIVVEVCFKLDERHVHKDLIYLIDPKLDGQIDALVWVCDSLSAVAVKMIEYYANRLNLGDKVALVVLTPEYLDADAPGQCRFRRETAIEPPSREDGFSGTNVRKELRNQAIQGEVDGPTIADVLGMSRHWVSDRLPIKPSSGRPQLFPKRDSLGNLLRGSDGRFRYDLETVLRFIDEAEKWVFRMKEVAEMIPLVSSEKAHADLVAAAEICKWQGAPKNLATVKSRAAPAKAFCFSISGQAYSLLYDREFALSLRG